MVEFKNNDKSCDIHTWGEFCEIIKGNGVQKADFVEEGFGCIHYGQIYTHYGPYTYSTNKFVSKATFDKARKASKGDVIMTDTSENVEDICKSVAYLGEDDIAVSNHALILKHNQNPKFLSYSTLTDCFLAQKRKVVVGVKVSGIKPEQLAKFKIYLPSLTEQKRIVEQLDTFTSSIENLKEQIAQRRKQYEYYRDQLLDLEGKPGVEMKKLGEIVVFRNGKGHEKIIIPDGKYIVVNSKFISSDGSVKKYCNEQISPLYVDDILMVMSDVPNGKAIAKCYLVERNNLYTLNQRIGAFHVCDSNVITKYLFYVINRNEQLLQYDNKIDQTNLKKDDILNITIPLPPLQEQQRIVSILDTFEASIRNLEQQLAQREKQYEYYRNILLSFE